ncbi:hypothetical protein MKZ38_010643 [Zalerion maritima]|uniref:Uncharacterized protein n=1 Tax=Zalerion maritima TaxID=339359 RepID=A0AAD5RSX3_9PEZI|nr:hypothetical protein MKZ38_010643 [Zalerion maritima]
MSRLSEIVADDHIPDNWVKRRKRDPTRTRLLLSPAVRTTPIHGYREFSSSSAIVVLISAIAALANCDASLSPSACGFREKEHQSDLQKQRRELEQRWYSPRPIGQNRRRSKRDCSSHNGPDKNSTTLERDVKVGRPFGYPSSPIKQDPATMEYGRPNPMTTYDMIYIGEFCERNPRASSRKSWCTAVSQTWCHLDADDTGEEEDVQAAEVRLTAPWNRILHRHTVDKVIASGALAAS